MQGRRRVLKSGTAIRNAICVLRGPKARAGESTRGGYTPSCKGGSGIFEFNMCVVAILMHFETIFACEIRLIVQAFHVAVFKRVSNPYH